MKKVLFCSICIIFCFYAEAQEINVSVENRPEAELSIAVNPANSDEIVVASMEPGGSILIYSSNDGGDSWTLSNHNAGVSDPVLTYGSDGTVYLVSLDFGSSLELHLASSSDNGINWSSQELVLDNMPKDRPWIVVDNSNSSPFFNSKYITYFHPSSTGIGIVRVSENGDVGSLNFVNSSSYQYVQNPAIGLTNNGTVIVAFLSQHQQGQFKLMGAHSIDGGANFTNEVAIADIGMYNSNGDPIADVAGFAPGSSSRLGNSLQMAIDHSGSPYQNRCYLTWTDFEDASASKGMNVYLSYSDDLGSTWSNPQVVNDDAVSSSHQYYSSISVSPSGTLCLSWYDRRSDPANDRMTDYYFTTSVDGGATFRSSVKLNTQTADHQALSDASITFGVGEYSMLASDAVYAYPLWCDGRKNDGNPDVYLAKVNIDDITSVALFALPDNGVSCSAFPNPVHANSEHIHLSLTLKEPAPLAIDLINIQGNVIKSLTKNKVFPKGTSRYSFAKKTLSPGTYHIRIKSEQSSLKTSVIIE